MKAREDAVRDAEAAAERAAAQRATIETRERALLAEVEGRERASREESRRRMISFQRAAEGRGAELDAKERAILSLIHI